MTGGNDMAWRADAGQRGKGLLISVTEKLETILNILMSV
jgi:hypothetical protein